MFTGQVGLSVDWSSRRCLWGIDDADRDVVGVAVFTVARVGSLVGLTLYVLDRGLERRMDRGCISRRFLCARALCSMMSLHWVHVWAGSVGEYFLYIDLSRDSGHLESIQYRKP